MNPLLGALAAMLLQTYATVTDARLEHPDAGDWLMYRRTYDGWGFSPLNEIKRSNIQNLSLAWSLSTDLVGAHETAVIVNVLMGLIGRLEGGRPERPDPKG